MNSKLGVQHRIMSTDLHHFEHPLTTTIGFSLRLNESALILRKSQPKKSDEILRARVRRARGPVLFIPGRCTRYKNATRRDPQKPSSPEYPRERLASVLVEALRRLPNVRRIRMSALKRPPCPQQPVDLICSNRPKAGRNICNVSYIS